MYTALMGLSALFAACTLAVALDDYCHFRISSLFSPRAGSCLVEPGVEVVAALLVLSVLVPPLPLSPGSSDALSIL